MDRKVATNYCEVCGAITTGECDLRKEIGRVIPLCIDCYSGYKLIEWLEENRKKREPLHNTKEDNK